MIYVLWASRGRPAIFAEALKRWVRGCKNLDNVVWNFTFDQDDTDFPFYKIPCELSHVRIERIPSQGKIRAMTNWADRIPESNTDFLVVAQDDVIPCGEWDLKIVSALDQAKAVFLYQNDCQAFPNLNTQVILRTKGLGLFHKARFYHHDYFSLFADNEYDLVTERSGLVYKTQESLLRHGWTNLTGFDALHHRNSNKAVYERDEKVFLRRKALGFPASSVLRELRIDE